MSTPYKTRIIFYIPVRFYVYNFTCDFYIPVRVYLYNFTTKSPTCSQSSSYNAYNSIRLQKWIQPEVRIYNSDFTTMSLALVSHPSFTTTNSYNLYTPYSVIFTFQLDYLFLILPQGLMPVCRESSLSYDYNACTFFTPTKVISTLRSDLSFS